MAGPLVVEPSITYGTLINIGATVVSVSVTGFLAYQKFKQNSEERATQIASRLTALEIKMNVMWGLVARRMGVSSHENEAFFREHEPGK